MRIQKIVIRFSLMLAGLFLLTHAVLPHTHHDGIVCFAHDYCHCSDHSTDQPEHQGHHEHNGINDCDLKDKIVRQSDSDDAQNTYQFQDFLSLCCIGYHLCGSHLEPPEQSVFFRQKPYLIFYTSPCVASVKSLRAPPFSLLG